VPDLPDCPLHVFLAKAGVKVIVLGKQSTPGGRAHQLKAQGSTFDLGPGWYWMRDVFDRFFHSFGKKTSDYYKLQRLDPSYRIYWPGNHTDLTADNDDHTDLPADLATLKSLFESIETGASSKPDRFLQEAAYKYRVGMQKLVLKRDLISAFFCQHGNGSAATILYGRHL
jgi:phytoene desaturase